MSFFASGLAMWSPPTNSATANNRTVPTYTGTITATSAKATMAGAFLMGDDAAQQQRSFLPDLYYHQPVYEPQTCVICGLPHQDTTTAYCDSKVFSYLINDPSTISSAPPEQSQSPAARGKDARIILLQKRLQWIWWKECILRIRHLWKKIVHQKRRHIHPTKR